MATIFINKSDPFKQALSYVASHSSADMGRVTALVNEARGENFQQGFSKLMKHYNAQQSKAEQNVVLDAIAAFNLAGTIQKASNEDQPSVAVQPSYRAVQMQSLGIAQSYAAAAPSNAPSSPVAAPQAAAAATGGAKVTTISQANIDKALGDYYKAYGQNAPSDWDKASLLPKLNEMAGKPWATQRDTLVAQHYDVNGARLTSDKDANGNTGITKQDGALAILGRASLYEAGRTPPKWNAGADVNRDADALMNKHLPRILVARAKGNNEEAADAVRMIGVYMAVGSHGFNKDPVKAYAWYKVAAVQGDEVAKDALKPGSDFMKSLAPEQKQKGEARAVQVAQWLEKNAVIKSPEVAELANAQVAPAAAVATTTAPAAAPTGGGAVHVAENMAVAKVGFTGDHYTVKHGDTLAGIARRTPDMMKEAKKAFPNATASERAYALALVIAKVNGVDAADSIDIGTKLKKPTAEQLQTELDAMKNGVFKEKVEYVKGRKVSEIFTATTPAAAVTTAVTGDATVAAAPDKLAAIVGAEEAAKIRAISDASASYSEFAVSMLPGLLQGVGITLTDAQKASIKRSDSGIVTSELIGVIEDTLGLKKNLEMDGQIFEAVKNPKVQAVLKTALAAAAVGSPAATPAAPPAPDAGRTAT